MVEWRMPPVNPALANHGHLAGNSHYRMAFCMALRASTRRFSNDAGTRSPQWMGCLLDIPNKYGPGAADVNHHEMGRKTPMVCRAQNLRALIIYEKVTITERRLHHQSGVNLVMHLSRCVAPGSLSLWLSTRQRRTEKRIYVRL
jgi:hypothetical protein